MKLRLQANSVRLRLKQAEVKRLIERGVVEESIRFLPSREVLTYRLELSATAADLAVRLAASELVIEVPAEAARAWAADSGQVGLNAVQPAGADAEHGLAILVEKDFACLDRDDEQNDDTFPHPLAARPADATPVP